MKKINEDWRRLDVDYPESLRSDLKAAAGANITRLVNHFGPISISMMDGALYELQTQQQKFPELFLKLGRFRDCCVHRKLDQAEFDQKEYGYEEKERV